MVTTISRRPLARLAVLTVAGAAALPLAVTAPQPAGASWQAPGYAQTIGGTGPAGVYAWGIQYNPVSGEMLVGDYWNYVVKRYDVNGNQVGSFYLQPSQRKGQPESLAVNPLNGDIWVAENGDQQAAGYIIRYDKSGNYIGPLSTGASYNAWITIDANAHLFVVNSHYNSPTRPPQVLEYDVSGSSPQYMGALPISYGSGVGQFELIHGIATDAAGNVYVNDAQLLKLSEYNISTHSWSDFGTAGRQQGQLSGDLRGMALDSSRNMLYVVDADAGRIDRYNLATNPPSPVTPAWGSLGSGAGQFADGGRQITVDGSGNVWVADYGNFRFMEFSPAGTLMATYPNPAQPPAAGFLSEVRDVAVDPGTGTVWAADSWSDRFQKYQPDGTNLGAWGYRGSTPPLGMDYPRGIGVDPSTHNVWVADTRDHIIRVFDQNGNYVSTIGSGLNSASQGSFEWPMDVEFYNGNAYVTDYVSCYLNIIPAASPSSAWRQIHICNNGVAVDPATGNIYVASWQSHNVSILNSSGSGIGSLQGSFTTPWGVDVVNGVVYVTDAKQNKVQAFTTGGSFLGSFGSAGFGPYGFNQPSGISHDSSGRIYIADANNDRIQVFSPSVPVVTGDSTPPTVTITAPAAKFVQTPAGSVTITGTAGDNAGIGSIQVAVRNASTGLWWNGDKSAWQTARAWNIAAPICSSTTSCTWSYVFIGVAFSGSYSTQVRVLDANTPTQNITQTKTIPFSVAAS